MEYRRATWAECVGGIGPDYPPFEADLEAKRPFLEQWFGHPLKIERVAVQHSPGFVLCGMALTRLLLLAKPTP